MRKPKQPVFQSDAYLFIVNAEKVYLEANGWVAKNPESWSHKGHERYHLVQGHAVNVQKQWDRMHVLAEKIRVEQKAKKSRVRKPKNGGT